MSRSEAKCHLCGADARLAREAHPGYRVGTSFSIYACTVCDTSFAYPQVVQADLYEDLYRNASSFPGYNRYASYAESVVGAEDPLGLLATFEGVYWGVAKALRERPQWKRVLEVGSGFGYLTYALSKSGFDAHGIDLSEEAVASARSRFGNLYDAVDLKEIAIRGNFEPWDTLVFTELIEHIPDTHGFITSALRLLKPGGGLVFTTPNKSLYPASGVWETDLPPVHVWWFSERSLEEISRRHDCELSLVDFTEFNRRSLLFIKTSSAAQQNRIDLAGNSLALPLKHSALWHMLRPALRLPILSDILCAATGRQRVVGPRSLSICAVLKPH